MAGPLYARYIPPKAAQGSQGNSSISTSVALRDNIQENSGGKRKRQDEDTNIVRNKKKKSDKGDSKRPKSEHESAGNHFELAASGKINHSPKHPKSKGDKKEKKGQKVKFDHENETFKIGDASKSEISDESRQTGSGEVQDQEKSSVTGNNKRSQGKPDRERQGKREEKLVSRADHNTMTHIEDEEDSTTAKHSSVMSKYEKSMRKQPREREIQTKAEQVDVHDLTPIPIPTAATNNDVSASVTVLPTWLSEPTSLGSDVRVSFRDLQLDGNLIEKLQRKGFAESLPIQSGLLPLLLPVATQHPGDLCVSAPTGSGKTLGYVLPIVQSLYMDVPTQLRALIVVPTRELVEQVRETAEMCVGGTSLRVGTAVGSSNLAVEQSNLVVKLRKYAPKEYSKLKLRLERRMTLDMDNDSGGESDDAGLFDEMSPAQELLELLPDHVPHYESKVDILVATPGRLVEHIKFTKGFSLAKLSWLVIDEADRLLDASFQEWVEVLLSTIEPRTTPQDNTLASFRLLNIPNPHVVRKVLLSATMTKDLDKLGDMRLKNPRLVLLEGTDESKTDAEGHKSTELPSTLLQFGVPVGNGADKPLYLLVLLSTIMKASHRLPATSDTSHNISVDTVEGKHMISERDASGAGALNSVEDHVADADNLSSNALIFTSSNEAAHRLSELLTRLRPEWKSKLATITKSSASRKTQKTLSAFRASKIRILVATDRASRGLDISNLENVINYDIPHDINSYIHRVGRTARAGRVGTAWTLLEDREAAWFWKQLAKSDPIQMVNGGVTRKRFDLSAIGSEIRGQYTGALEELQEAVKGYSKWA